MSTFFSAGPFKIPPFHTTSAKSPTIIINAIAQMALLAAPFPSSAILIAPPKKILQYRRAGILQIECHFP
jgi:hypothetical protein